MVEAFATGDPGDLRIIVINKSFDPQTADITVSGLNPGAWESTSYLFDKTRVAQFQGAKPGDAKHGGTFQGYPNDDSISEQSLKPLATLPCSNQNGNALLSAVKCPPLSLVVLKLKTTP